MLLGAPYNLSSQEDSVYAKVAVSNIVGQSEFSEAGNGAFISMSYPPDAPQNLLRDEDLTSKTVLAFSWEDGASDGGQPILDYRISYDQARDDWKTLLTGVTTKSITVEGATPGKTYQFKIDSRNVIGYSQESAPITIKAAIIPSAPQQVQTVRVLNDVIVSWESPSSNPLQDFADELESYWIFIRTSDDAIYAQDLTSCPGTDLVNLSCTLTMSQLMAEPFNLSLGDSVFAYVIAVNSIGSSPESVEGNGAVVFVVVEPDAPVNLERNSATTTTSAVGLTWDDGAYNGGDAIIDYRVSFDNGLGDWTVLQAGVTQRSFVRNNLNQGVIYSFKVEARNAIGYSQESEVVQIRCAIEPAQPSAPTTLTVINDVKISWLAPVTDNGASISAYQILIRHNDNTNFSE